MLTAEGNLKLNLSILELKTDILADYSGIKSLCPFCEIKKCYGKIHMKRNWRFTTVNAVI